MLKAVDAKALSIKGGNRIAKRKADQSTRRQESFKKEIRERLKLALDYLISIRTDIKKKAAAGLWYLRWSRSDSMVIIEEIRRQLTADGFSVKVEHITGIDYSVGVGVVPIPEIPFQTTVLHIHWDTTLK